MARRRVGTLTWSLAASSRRQETSGDLETFGFADCWMPRTNHFEWSFFDSTWNYYFLCLQSKIWNFTGLAGSSWNQSSSRCWRSTSSDWLCAIHQCLAGNWVIYKNRMHFCLIECSLSCSYLYSSMFSISRAAWAGQILKAFSILHWLAGCQARRRFAAARRAMHSPQGDACRCFTRLRVIPKITKPAENAAQLFYPLSPNHRDY